MGPNLVERLRGCAVNGEPFGRITVGDEGASLGGSVYAAYTEPPAPMHEAAPQWRLQQLAGMMTHRWSGQWLAR